MILGIGLAVEEGFPTIRNTDQYSFADSQSDAAFCDLKLHDCDLRLLPYLSEVTTALFRGSLSHLSRLP